MKPNLGRHQLGNIKRTIFLWAEAERDHVQWISPLVAIFMLTFIGCWTDRKWISWDLSGDIFFRLALAVMLVGTLIFAFLRLRENTAIPKPDWWNLSGIPNHPTWEDIRCLTLGDLEHDPVVFQPELKYAARTLKSIAGNIVIGAIALEGVSALVSAPILPRLLYFSNSNDPNLSPVSPGFVTALLALIAAVASIYFTYRQLQAKVKADSRQAWLNKLRGEIARFIASSDALQYNIPPKERRAVQRELTASRLEMELLLNPSEKDHRLLMFLSIKLAFFQSNDAEFNKVHDVRNLKKAIEGEPKYDKQQWRNLLGSIPDRDLDKQAHENAYGDLIGYLMRLSHVVLKREWERVKRTR